MSFWSTFHFNIILKFLFRRGFVNYTLANLTFIELPFIFSSYAHKNANSDAAETTNNNNPEGNNVFDRNSSGFHHPVLTLKYYFFVIIFFYIFFYWFILLFLSLFGAAIIIFGTRLFWVWDIFLKKSQYFICQW